MSPATVECPDAPLWTDERDQGGGQTLEVLIAELWEALDADGCVACPVCGEQRMQARYSAGSAAVGGRCQGCGSSLS
jgi:hypothetical protein